MKKVVSLLLAVMMVFSVVAVGAVSASAADVALKAGSRIFFDNSEAKWENVYFYAWNYGFFGDFVPMKSVEGKENLYSVVVPVDVPNGAEYFLFTDSKTWSGHQTQNQKALTGVNTYAPTTADAGTVVTSYTAYPKTTEVAITPYSKQFTDSIDVTVYAFNLTEGQTASYTINDADPVTFDEPVTITLKETATVTVTAGDATETCTFTKVTDAHITVTAMYESGKPYTGDIYVYTFGGDRVGAAFNLMTPIDVEYGEYEYYINGSAQVIFTTTNNWNTAVKFTICNAAGVPLSDQEPLVSAGQNVTYILKIADPATEATTAE